MTALVLTGFAASRGIALGRARLLEGPQKNCRMSWIATALPCLMRA
jgi:hypothetical protein